MYQLDRTIATIYAELDLLCVCIILMAGIVTARYYHSVNKRVNWLVFSVGICYAVALVSDAIWVCLEYQGTYGAGILYFLNSIYFVALPFGASLWMIYICRRLQYGFSKTKLFVILALIPSVVVSTLAVTAPVNNLLFYINENMKYDRGSWYAVYLTVHYGLYLTSMAFAVYRYFLGKLNDDLRDASFVGIIYPVPILILSSIFVGSGLNSFCLGYVFSIFVLFAAKVVQLGKIHKEAIEEGTNAEDRQSKYISGLGENYEELMYYNFITGEEEVIKKNEKIRRSVDVSIGKSFYDRMMIFVESFVVEEDRELVINGTNQESIHDVVSNGRPCIIRFRTAYSGKIQWYEMVITPPSDRKDKSGLMLGLRDCSYEVEKSNKTKKLLNRYNRDKKLEERYKIIRVLSGNYLGLFYIDLNTRRFEVISSSRQTARLVPDVVYSENEAAKALLKYTLQLVHPDDRHLFVGLKSFDDIKKLVENTQQYIMLFRRDIDGIYRYCEFVVAKPDDNDVQPTSIAIGIAEKDEIYRAKIESERQLAIISELSEDFEYVDYVSANEDIGFDKAEEFRVSDAIIQYVPGFLDTNRFSKRIELLINNIGYEPEIEKFKALTKREVVLDHLRTDNTYAVNTRILMDNQILYYQLKFAADRAQDGTLKGIVVGAHNVDDEIRREMELREGIERLVDIQTEELRNKNKALAKSNEKVVEMLGSLVEGRDADSGEHIIRTKKFTYILIKKVMEESAEYNLTPAKINMITLASPLHDVGKISIPDAILKKPGKLTDEEFEEMKTHCEKGVDIIESMYVGDEEDYYVNICKDICRYHHEKWDGKGYPEGLKGDDIPIAAQVVSVADCFDALTSERVYKSALKPEEAFEMILDGKCGVFSEKLMNCFRACRSELILSSGSSKRFNLSDEGEDRNEERAKAFDGLTILVVDDDPLARHINGDILTIEGGLVTTAENGAEALALIEEGARFDVILMDLIMPKMDGYEAIRRIRDLEKKRHIYTPIIAITAEKTKQNIEASLNAGADNCIGKPLEISELAKAIISYMRDNSKAMTNKLNATIRNANTDPLTKVKNNNAYQNKIIELNQLINESNDTRFAIVMCDINDLKFENDNFGHDTGDRYIQNCCKLLCSVFIGSPIYRIGGDEFIAVLQGDDYYNRTSLMLSLKERVEKSSKISSSQDGKASIAAGMAEYDENIDSSAIDVVKRADVAMYSNKRRMKHTDY